MRNIISGLILGISLIAAVVVFAWMSRDIGRYQLFEGEYPHSRSISPKTGPTTVEEEKIKTVLRIDTKTGEVAYIGSGSAVDYTVTPVSVSSWNTWNYINEHGSGPLGPTKPAQWREKQQ